MKYSYSEKAAIVNLQNGFNTMTDLCEYSSDTSAPTVTYVIEKVARFTGTCNVQFGVAAPPHPPPLLWSLLLWGTHNVIAGVGYTLFSCRT